MTKQIEKKLIGLTLEEAKKVWSNIRVLQNDNQKLAGTGDYKPSRANVALFAGRIEKFIKWG